MSFKKWLILLSCFLLLNGCGRKQEPTQGALDFRTALMDAEGCSFAADVSASYEDRVYDFSMTCVHTKDKTALTVTKPQAIAGISASVENGKTQLEFDGAILEFGRLANGYVSPVAAPWLLVQCWTGEYIAYAGPDGDMERITYLRGYNDEEVAVDTWLQNGIPTYAEVSYGGVRCLTITISEFQYTA